MELGTIDRIVKSKDAIAMMYGCRKSDSSIVPEKSSNKSLFRDAEVMEERWLAKGSPPKQNTLRTQSRIKCAKCV